MASPFTLDFQPGVQRDGTQFDATRCLDALWCRWRLGRPRKIGGYRQITGALLGVPRSLHCFYSNGQTIAHVGTTTGIQQVVFDQFGNLVSIADRTPTTGFSPNGAIGYTMDAIFDTTSDAVQLVVQGAVDTQDLSNSLKSVPLIGMIDQTSRLSQFSNPSAPSPGTWIQPNVSGGIACVQPYVFDFDSDGLVQWSAPNLPLYLGVTGGSSGAGQARISAQKVVACKPLRGGGVQSPAALFWSLSEVIVANFVGGSPVWAFNTLSPSSSILASDAVIEYDGLYFWAGIDRFLMFNGIVTEVPNPQNQDWFFDNLTPGYEARTFAFKVPRYGEIWWCACMFGATEPNYAAIYNVRENCWYDTALPDGGRGAGYFAQGFKYPIMAGVEADAAGYSLWMHEFGVDRVAGSSVSPIRSYFETAWFGGPKDAQPDDRGLSFEQLEPDLQQSGDLQCYLIGAANARANQVAGPTETLREVPGSPQEQFVSFKQNARLTRLHVESDTLGGNYICGRNLGHATPSNARLMS